MYMKNAQTDAYKEQLILLVPVLFLSFLTHMFSYSLMYSESEVCSGRIESSLIGGPHHKIFILVQFYGLTKYTHLFDCIHNKLFIKKA